MLPSQTFCRPSLATVTTSLWIVVACAACSGDERAMSSPTDVATGADAEVDSAVVQDAGTEDTEPRDAATVDAATQMPLTSAMLETVAPSEVTAAQPSLSLSLVDAGIAADLTLHDVRLRVRVRGQVAGIEYDSLGWVTLDTLRLQAVFDVQISGGRPSASLRGDSLTTSVSGVSTDFSDVDGAIIDLLADLFKGSLRSELASKIQGVANQQLAGAVSEVLSGLDVSDLGGTVSVPKLGGEANIDLQLGVSLQSLAVTPERMTLGVASSVDGDLARPMPELGVPARDLTAGERTADAPFAVSVHEALASQLVLGMWRGGMFDANLDGRDIDGLPKALKGRMSVEMPPVIELIGDRLRLSAGSIALDLQYTPLFGAEPVQARAALRLSGALRIDQGRIALGDIHIDELRLATSRPDLMNLQSESVQSMLLPALQLLLSPALEKIAPSIPMPTLAVPSVLSGGAQAARARLSLASPLLTFEAPRAVIAGEPALQ